MDTLKDAIVYCKNIYKIEADDKWGHFEQIRKWLQELKDIKDAQKNGTNITLPCNVIDTLYLIEPLWMYSDGRWKDEKFQTIHKLSIKEKFIDHFEIGRDNEVAIILTDNLRIQAKDFGVCIFSSIEEAKSVLEKAKETFEKNNIHFRE